MLPLASEEALPFRITTSAPSPPISVTVWSGPAFAVGGSLAVDGHDDAVGTGRTMIVRDLQCQGVRAH